MPEGYSTTSGNCPVYKGEYQKVILQSVERLDERAHLQVSKRIATYPLLLIVRLGVEEAVSRRNLSTLTRADDIINGQATDFRTQWTIVLIFAADSLRRQ